MNFGASNGELETREMRIDAGGFDKYAGHRRLECNMTGHF
jgi:hypothetical protein